MLGRRAKDKLTEVSALYHKGLLQAQEGDLDNARDMLAKAHAAFVLLQAPEATQVEEDLKEIKRTLIDKKIYLDRVLFQPSAQIHDPWAVISKKDDEIVRMVNFSIYLFAFNFYFLLIHTSNT